MKIKLIDMIIPFTVGYSLHRIVVNSVNENFKWVFVWIGINIICFAITKYTK
jgi:hypothetical protein